MKRDDKTKLIRYIMKQGGMYERIAHSINCFRDTKEWTEEQIHTHMKNFYPKLKRDTEKQDIFRILNEIKEE